MTDATIALKVDSSGLKQGQAEMDRLGQKGRQTEGQLSQSTDKMGKSFSGAATAVKAVTAALVAMGATRALTDTIRTGAQFQQSMAEVKAITRSTATEFVQLEATARRLGATTEFTGSQAASALKFLGMAGFSAAEAVKSVPQILDLATAAAMDLGTAADITSNIMSAFGIQAENTTRVTDVLAAASSRANTDVGQLGEAMKFVGPVASAMGVDVGDAAAAVGVLSDAGIQGSMAGTGLRRVLSSLANPTNQAQEALAAMGITLDEVNPATQSVVDIVARLAEGGIDAADALTIFGDRGGPAILALTDNVPRLRELTETLSNVEGESARMANTMRDTVAGDFKTLGSAAQDLQINLFNAFAPDIRNNVQGMTSAVRFLSENLSTIGTIVQVSAVLFAARLAPSIYASAAAMVAKTTATIGATTAIGALNVALKLIGGPIGLVVIAGAALAKMFERNREVADFFTSSIGKADDELNQLRRSGAPLERQMDVVERAIKDVKSELENTSLWFGENSKDSKALKQELRTLEGQLLNLERQQDAYNLAIAKGTEGSDAFVGPIQAVTAALNEQSGAVNEVVAKLKAEQDQLGMTAVEIEIHKNLTEAATTADTALGKEIVALTMNLHAEKTALEAETKAQEASTAATEKATEAVAKQIAEMQSEFVQLGMNERQQFIYNAELTAFSNGASVDAIRQISAMAGANFDLAQEQKGAATAAAELEAATVKAAEEAQRNWERTHEYLSTTFVDIFNNGKDAFGKIEDSFKAMIKRMVAEWAASKLMNLFGIGSGSGGTATSFFDSITGGGGGGGGSAAGNIAGSVAQDTIIDAISSSKAMTAVKSALGIGGGAVAAGTAVGGTAGVSTVFAAGAPSAAGITSSAIGASGTGAAAAGGGGLAGAGNAVMGAIKAIPGWGWALGAAALAAAALSKKSTPSSNAGMLVGPAPGVSADRTFAVDAFASGFKPTGFARREDQSAAIDVISAFAAVDATLTEAIRAAGGDINMASATLAGFDEKGQGSGVFFGVASEKGKGVTSTDMESQLARYARDVMRHASGLTEEQKAGILGVHGSHAAGLDRVPFDGYRAQLHRGEEVLRSGDPRNQNNGGMMDEFRMMRSELVRIGQQTKRTSDILLRVTRDGNALLTEAV